jgi:protein disulfide-isomerase A6
MKPAWDDLSAEYESSSSVVIADVDCTIESALCQKYEVKGYPTIKYWADGEQQAYSGGRDFDTLKQFVVDNLERGCDVNDPSSCSEKEQKYIEKMSDKDSDVIAKEIARLTGMKDNKMKKEQKQFLLQRIAILQQM